MGVTWTVVSRRDCHLCREMLDLLDREGSRLGVEYTVVDVDEDAALRERFGDVVPVLLRDGKPVAKVRLDAAILTRLARRRR